METLIEPNEAAELLGVKLSDPVSEGRTRAAVLIVGIVGVARRAGVVTSEHCAFPGAAMTSYTPEVQRILRRSGWRSERSGKGDHEIWHDPRSRKHVTVDAKIRARHTGNAILKQAGLPKQF